MLPARVRVIYAQPRIARYRPRRTYIVEAISQSLMPRRRGAPHHASHEQCLRYFYFATPRAYFARREYVINIVARHSLAARPPAAAAYAAARRVAVAAPQSLTVRVVSDASCSCGAAQEPSFTI